MIDVTGEAAYRAHKRRTPAAVYPKAATGELRATNAEVLVWTDWLLLALIAVQFLIVTNPFNLEFRHSSLTKHGVYVMTFPLLLFQFVAASVRSGTAIRKAFGNSLRMSWPIVVLGMAVVAGSVYAKRVENISENFLTMGMYMLVYPLVLGAVLVSKAPTRLFQAYFWIWTVAALAMSARLVVKWSHNPYHEEVFLLIPLAVLFHFTKRLGIARMLPLALFLSMAVISRKNTSHLLGLVVVLYMMLVIWWPLKGSWSPDTRRLMAMLKAYAMVLALCGVAAATVFLIENRDKYLQSGNVEYRTHMYGLMWKKFLESPLVGSMFTDSSVVRFDLYQVFSATQNLPVHSDFMDMLAHGGFVGIALWLIGIGVVFRSAWIFLIRPKHQGASMAGMAHALFLSSVCGVVVYCFNPVLTALPALAFLLWTNLGLLGGMAILRSRELAAEGT